MPSFTTSEPKAGGGSFLVEPGEYQLRVVDAVEALSKAQNEMIEVTFRLSHADGTEGPRIFENLVFSEKTMWRVDQFVAACGKHPGKGVNLDLYPSLIIGWTCRAKIKVERYNEKDRNKVEEFLIDPETVGAVAGADDKGSW